MYTKNTKLGHEFVEILMIESFCKHMNRLFKGLDGKKIEMMLLKLLFTHITIYVNAFGTFMGIVVVSYIYAWLSQ